jgi:hypothetical protein
MKSKPAQSTEKVANVYKNEKCLCYIQTSKSSIFKEHYTSQQKGFVKGLFRDP